MKCPYCNNQDTKVVDSRDTDEGRSIRRRRECLNKECKGRFSTYEQVELLTFSVVKKSGRKSEYKKHKLEEGIHRAAKKRLDEEAVNQLISEIEADIYSLGKEEISTKEIGEIVMKRLKEKDEVAYLRFASVFKSFGSGKRFVKELNKLEGK